MNTYRYVIGTQKVPSMIVGGQTLVNVVTLITGIYCSAVDEEGLEGPEVHTGRCPLGLANPDPATFIPMEELTAEQVEAWSLEKLGAEGVADLNTRADARLTEQKAANMPVPGPVFDTRPPSVPEPEPEEEGEPEGDEGNGGV